MVPLYDIDLSGLSGLNEDAAELRALRPDSKAVLGRVAELCGLTVEQLHAPCRNHFTITRRWRAMHLLHLAGLSEMGAGKILKRDRVTVRHGLGKVREAIAAAERMAAE